VAAERLEQRGVGHRIVKGLTGRGDDADDPRCSSRNKAN
jgi:hypothetical protein